MRKLFKILKITTTLILLLIAVLITWSGYLYYTADMKQPQIDIIEQFEVINKSNFRQIGDNYLRQNENGLWELKIKGNAFTRGYIIGKLTDSLLYFQEKVFVDQIREIIPSDNYLKFLRFFLVLFNRNLGKNVIDEYRNEIYGISLSCTNEYDFIGTPYERQLNYHAAHDIGHAMQDYMLVGCSSFAVWDKFTTDSTLLIGRNFDFYVGDAFAKNKLITFCEPSNGYKFASISWPGMIGVLSGINEQGLTVTINAAKSSIPTSAATPISLLTREILQYASTIEEAYDIAKKRKTFVSESILIGSAKDKRAAIIEKSPDKVALFFDFGGKIICTNHFQTKEFSDDKRNIENITTTDSYPRYLRLDELISDTKQIDEYEATSILRNRMGIENINLGLSNELSINQSIAHHAVIFKPEKMMMWVSTSPWQSGKFIAYDLNKIFNNESDFKNEINSIEHTIAADSVFLLNDYDNLITYRNITKYINEKIKNKDTVAIDTLIKYYKSNPEYFHTYEILGDYYYSIKEFDKATQNWKQALNKPIPKQDEIKRINRKIQKCSK